MCIFTLPSTIAGGTEGNPLVREIEYIGLHMADHVFAVSERTKQTLIDQYDIPAEKITVARNVMEISPKLINESCGTYQYIEAMRDEGYKVVVNAGRMTIQKGLVFLLQTARQVIDRNPKTLFLFVGGGEQIPELQQIASDLGIAKTLFSRDELKESAKHGETPFGYRIFTSCLLSLSLSVWSLTKQSPTVLLRLCRDSLVSAKHLSMCSRLIIGILTAWPIR